MPHYENVPFEVPETWEWVRLDSIGDIVTGSTPPKDNKELYGGHIPFYKPTDLEQGINTTTSTDSLTEEGFAVARQLPTDSILVTCIGATIGKTGMIRKAGTCNQQINAIVSFPGIFPDYIYYVCISDFMQSNIKDNASATTLPILNKNHFAELRIPLPPIEEQKRIVAAIEKWFSLIDTLESAKEDLQTSIAQAKSKILDLAIHGKLVPQDPNDEPAVELLRRINPKFTPCDNAHKRKDFLAGWCTSTIGDYVETVTDFVASGSFASLRENVTYYKTPNYAILVKTQDFQNGFTDDLTYTDQHGYEFLQKSNLYGGELIISNVGSIGKLFIVPKLNKRMTLAPNSIMVRFYEEAHIKWFYYLFSSKYGYNLLMSISSATAISKFNKTDFKKLSIPIPPLNEQKRIVTKIEELFAVLDEIQKSINSSFGCCLGRPLASK